MIEITDEMRDIVEQYANIYRRMLDESGHNASGKLRNFQTEITQDGKYFNIIFDLEDYWIYLENGRKAGKMPPIESVLQWITVKPIVPRAVNGKIPSTSQLAFLIARKIGREGTPATKLLSISNETAESDMLIDKLIDLIFEKIEEEVNKEIEDDILG